MTATSPSGTGLTPLLTFASSAASSSLPASKSLTAAFLLPHAVTIDRPTARTSSLNKPNCLAIKSGRIFDSLQDCSAHNSLCILRVLGASVVNISQGLADHER